MASIRAMYIIASDLPNRCLFSRKFFTIENRLKSKLKDQYTPIPNNDKIILNAFYQQIIREEHLQEELIHSPYTDNLNIDHLKFEELVNEVDIKFDINNFNSYSECPIITLHIENNKMNYDLWPCCYINKYKLYAIIFPNIDYDLYSQIFLNKNTTNNYNEYQKKKHYEDKDSSIICSFTFLDNLLNYICDNKKFEENKIHTWITNMLPFGSIIETNFRFMNSTLAFHNQKLQNTNGFFNNFNLSKNYGSNKKDEHLQAPGWATVLPSKNSNEVIILNIHEELKFVKYPKDSNKEKYFNMLLCDISCQVDLNKVCEITVPIKEITNIKGNCLANLRVHPSAKVDDMSNLTSTSTRIIFVPVNNENIIWGATEIQNISPKHLPITGSLQLKESDHNEVKIYLKLYISKSAIGNFEYFNITIPWSNFGVIQDTKIMVQVGDVILGNNKTSLFWDLQNKVSNTIIIWSGTVFFTKDDRSIKSNKVQNNAISNNMFDDYVNYNVEEMIKKTPNRITSDIRDNNCFCLLNFMLNNYSLSGWDIDKKLILFYPKITPKVEIKKEFRSLDYKIWNDLSFNNYEINIPERGNEQLLTINIEEDIV